MPRKPTTPRTFVADGLASPLLHDRVMEQRLAGYLLLRPDRATEVLHRLRPEHFRDTVCAAVVLAAKALHEARQAPHLHAVAAELVRLGRTDVTPVDLMRLTEGLAVGARWEDYAARVMDAARRRAIYYALGEAREALTVEHDFGVVRDAVYRALDSADDAEHPVEQDSWEALSGALSKLVDGDEAAPLSTKIPKLDELLDGGLPRAGMTIVGARTSIGKTALAATVAMNLADTGHRVSFMSLEMTRARMALRFAALASGEPVADWRKGEVPQQAYADFTRVRPMCLDTRARTLGSIRSRAFQHRRLLGGLDLLVIDYLQLLDLQLQAGEKRYEGLGRMSMGLTQLAQDLNCAVVALSQLSREAMVRPEPEVSDLRESGNLEQDAEMVWLLYYPRDKNGRPVAGARPVLKVAKNRNGRCGKVPLEFDAGRMRFSGRDEEEVASAARKARPVRPATPVKDGEVGW